MGRTQKRRASTDPSTSASCSVAYASDGTENDGSQQSQENQCQQPEAKRTARRGSENDVTQSDIPSQSESLPADDDASVCDSTKTTLSTANERRRGLVDSGFVPPENDGHGSPEPDPERVLRQLRVPSNVELFYRTPNPFRYGLRMRLNDEGGRDYFETLPVDIILMIFSYLNKTDLVMAAMCCRRFRDIGYNQSLWEFMDLGQKFVTDTEIHSLMDRGVRYLRLTYTTIIAKQNDSVNSSPDSQPTHSSPTEEPQQPRVFPSKLTHLDLSGSAIERPDIFASILRRCTKLEGVSLEHRRINDDVCAALSQNEELRYLALTMCEGLTHNGLKTILQGCRRLLELNLAWTSLAENHVAVALELMPRGLKRLNLSGIREADALIDEDVMKLTMRCPNLTEVDLSDCPGITDRSLKAMLHNLEHLKVLSISRCYGIEPTALLLAKHLRTLNVFGNITNEGVILLREHLNRVNVNESCFSTIAVPTHGKDITSIWGHRTRDIY